MKSSIERTVEVKYELAKQGDYLNLLGIDRSDPADQIRQAYLRWVKMVHPDNLGRHGIEHLREKAAKVFKSLSAAYEIFSDEAKKSAYLAALDRGDGDPANAENPETRSRNEAESAKIVIHQARLLLRRRAWSDAEELLRGYVKSYPTDSRALTLMGWCVFQNEGNPEMKRLQEARDFWESAVKADEENADAHYHLSLYYKITGGLAQQEKSLKRAIKLDSSHVAALREVRLLEMRKGNLEKKGPESMGDFFKRIWVKLNKKKSAPEPEPEPDARRKTRPKAKR
ncbi:MAG: DnaJ domain-containing protein [Pseudomonadota bacterium]